VKSTDQIIATKVGHIPGTAEHAFEKLHIRQPLLPPPFGENDKYLPEAAETVHALKKEGKIRHIGQSAYSEADFAKTIPVVKPIVRKAGHTRWTTRSSIPATCPLS
jgi:aryl-alcohol dehydrogenase-like predicted oxidoreductase